MHLVLDLDHVEGIVRQRLAEVENVESVQLLAAGDGLDLRASLRWKGMGSQVSIRVGEIRMRDRFLGLRLSRLRILGGVPVPMSLVEAIASRVKDQPLTVFRGTGIIVVDLGQWLPDGLSAEIVTVQSVGRELHVWLGRGFLTDLPQPPRKALPPASS